MITRENQNTSVSSVSIQVQSTVPQGRQLALCIYFFCMPRVEWVLSKGTGAYVDVTTQIKIAIIPEL